MKEVGVVKHTLNLSVESLTMDIYMIILRIVLKLSKKTFKKYIKFYKNVVGLVA
jgi:hypothetical protein